MKKFCFSMLIAFLVGTLSLAVGQHQADASAILEISDGITTKTVTDNGTGDEDGAVGVIEYSPGFGESPFPSWTLIIETGISKPVIGAADNPQIDLISVEVSGGAGDLTISFTDTGFTDMTSGLDGFTTELGGTVAAGGTVSLTSYLDGSNAGFGMATPLASLGPFTGGAFSGSEALHISPSGLYSLTLVAEISHTESGITSFDAHILPNPEPGTIILLGLGLTGLVGMGIRRKRKQKRAEVNYL